MPIVSPRLRTPDDGDAVRGLPLKIADTRPEWRLFEPAQPRGRRVLSEK